MQILLAWVLNAVALWITAYVVPGFEISDPTSALIAAVVIGFINAFVRPVLLFMTAPVNVVTLGLFTFVINAAVLWLAAQIVPGFAVGTLLETILAAVILSFVSTLLAQLLKDLTKK